MTEKPNSPSDDRRLTGWGLASTQYAAGTPPRPNPSLALSSKQRADLRAEAHHLRAIVHIGQHGLTDASRQTVDDALRTHELVKLQFTKTADLDVRGAANELATALSADVVQVIGRTATLYRQNPELKRKDGVPPWRT